MTMTSSIQGIADTVMQGVVGSGVVTHSNAPRACEVMRAEIKSLLTGDSYADERACILAGSVSERYVLARVIVECVAKITEDAR